MRTHILRTTLLALLLALAAGGARASVKGDVNGDQMVSVTDVTLLVNIILGETDDYDEYAADLNGDSYITVADVTLLVNIILGGDYSFIPDTQGGEVSDDPAIGPAQAPQASPLTPLRGVAEGKYGTLWQGSVWCR